MIEIDTHPVTFGGSTKKGKPYDNFKSDIKSQFKCEEIKCENKISLNIVLCIKEDRIRHNRNDLDNFLKPIIDALAEKQCFDEAQIDEIHIKRKMVGLEDKEGIEIEINTRFGLADSVVKSIKKNRP